MSEWFSYSPEDLLLFSPRVYARLFELHNAAVWPAHVLALVLGLALVYLVVRPPARSSLMIGLVLALVWVWVGWSFLWHRYASINWAVAYGAPLFALQGLALAWAGASNRLAPANASPGSHHAAVALLLFAIGYAALFGPMGRPSAGAELFGIAPDPTAIATVAILASAPTAPLMLLVLPVAWLLLSSGVLHLLQAPAALVPMLAALAGIAVAVSARLHSASR